MFVGPKEFWSLQGACVVLKTNKYSFSKAVGRYRHVVLFCLLDFVDAALASIPGQTDLTLYMEIWLFLGWCNFFLRFGSIIAQVISPVTQMPQESKPVEFPAVL